MKLKCSDRMKLKCSLAFVRIVHVLRFVVPIVAEYETAKSVYSCVFGLNSRAVAVVSKLGKWLEAAQHRPFVGLNKGHIVTKKELAPRPSIAKGGKSVHHVFVLVVVVDSRVVALLLHPIAPRHLPRRLRDPPFVNAPMRTSCDEEVRVLLRFHGACLTGCVAQTHCER
ncbi:hypothetical protein NL676_036566 [Syzygium grande]|nr:hypothetical protein NL676_036566 [Syzygium grande]